MSAVQLSANRLLRNTLEQLAVLHVSVRFLGKFPQDADVPLLIAIRPTRGPLERTHIWVFSTDNFFGYCKSPN